MTGSDFICHHTKIILRSVQSGLKSKKRRKEEYNRKCRRIKITAWSFNMRGCRLKMKNEPLCKPQN